MDPVPESVLEPEEEEPQKPEVEPGWRNTLKTMISLGLYIAVYALVFKGHLSYIFLLVVVIFLHEMGHLIAMKKFGYRDVQMFFIPFLGAYVSGEPRRISQYQKSVTLLAGPLPGILLGLICGWQYYLTGHPIFYQLALLFLLLNIFNLLPVRPLDGGQLMETLFLESNRLIQTFFTVISAIAMIAFALSTRNYLFLLILPLLLLRLRVTNNTHRIRKILDAKGINYHLQYDDLSDEDYWNIRKEMISQIPALRNLNPDIPDENESAVASYMKPILNIPSQNDLSKTQKLIFFLIWFCALVGPVLLYIYYNLTFMVKE